MIYVQRDSGGSIVGIYANRQPGFAEETLSAEDGSVAAFRNRDAPSAFVFSVETMVPR